MFKSSHRTLTVLTGFFLLLPWRMTSRAQEMPIVLADGELAKIVPTSFYFEGQSGPTQMRNSAAVKLAANRHVIAGLVDTSGYSSAVREKYEGFFITDSSITVGGKELGTGAYGFGFSSQSKMNLFDISGRLVLSVEVHRDEKLKSPRPLTIMKAADGVRLYKGRNYVIVALR